EPLEPAVHRRPEARQRVVLEAVEGVRREPRQRLPLDAGAHARAVVRVGVLLFLLLEQKQADLVVVPREVRLEEVRGERPAEQRSAGAEAELARAAEEIVVPPGSEPADLLLGVVADAETHLVLGALAHPDADVDARITAL